MHHTHAVLALEPLHQPADQVRPSPPGLGGQCFGRSSCSEATKRASWSSENSCTSTPKARLILSNTATVSGRWFCSSWFR